LDSPERKPPGTEEKAYREHAQEPEPPSARPDVEHPKDEPATSPDSSYAARHDLDVDANAAEKARQSIGYDQDHSDVEDQSTQPDTVSDSLLAEDESSDPGKAIIEELQRRKPK